MKIVHIIEVRDTRTYKEGPDGRWHPIPGSGQSHDCARCGRSHEVHVEVVLEDSTQAVVGTGCMTATDLVPANTIRSAAARARRLARLQAELAHAQKQAAKADRVCAEVLALPVPEIIREYVTAASGKRVLTVRVGADGPAFWCQLEDRTAEAVEAWRTDVIRVRCPSPWKWRPLVEVLEAQIARLRPAVTDQERQKNLVRPLKNP